jgi:Zn-dependent protease
LDINVAQIFIAILVLLLSLTVHESAHAWTADRLGDPTGRLLGRVSLNPVVHIDPLGTLVFPLLAVLTNLPLIGWAKPVPVNVRNLRNHRRDYLFIAAAGPTANLAMAVLASILLRAVAAASVQPGAPGFYGPAAQVLSWMLHVNLLLAIFNMIPVPPLDGSSVLAGLLPERLAHQVDQLRPYGFIMLYGLILTGALTRLVNPPYRLLLSWLL